MSYLTEEARTRAVVVDVVRYGRQSGPLSAAQILTRILNDPEDRKRWGWGAPTLDEVKAAMFVAVEKGELVWYSPRRRAGADLEGTVDDTPRVRAY